MNAYRTPAPPTEDSIDTQEVDREEIYVLIPVLMVGLLRTAAALVRGETFGTEATISFLAIVFCGRALLRQLVRALRRWSSTRSPRRTFTRS